VNSARRSKKIQAEIEKRLGGAARLLEDKVKPLADMLKEAGKLPRTREDRKAERADKELRERPEVQEAIRKMAEAHWEGWLDGKLPILGGKTPRQAVRDPDGREMVEALLLDIERMERRTQFPADIPLLRRRLGLTPEPGEER